MVAKPSFLAQKGACVKLALISGESRPSLGAIAGAHWGLLRRHWMRYLLALSLFLSLNLWAQTIHYASGNVAFDGTRVYYDRKQKTVLFDGSDKIKYPNGKVFKSGNRYYYPNGAKLQHRDAMSYPQPKSLYTGLNLSWADSSMFASTSGEAYFLYPNGKNAMNYSGSLFLPDGQPLREKPLVLFENIRDKTMGETYGYMVAVLGGRDNWNLEINFHRLFNTRNRYVSVLPLRWRPGKRVPTLKNSTLLIETGSNNQGILIRIRDHRVQVKPTRFNPTLSWKVLAPTGVLTGFFNDGVLPVSARFYLRDAMMRALGDFPQLPGPEQPYAIEGPWGRVNVEALHRIIYPKIGVGCTELLIQKATECIRFEKNC